MSLLGSQELGTIAFSGVFVALPSAVAVTDDQLGHSRSLLACQQDPCEAGGHNPVSQRGNLLKGQLQGLGQGWGWNPGFWPHWELGTPSCPVTARLEEEGNALGPSPGVLEASCRSCLGLLRHLLRAGLLVSGILML